MTTAIAIVPYDDRWPAEFRRIGTSLREALDDLALRIDHIGSTAVPGLAAKDIVDVQVTVAALDAAAIAAALAPLGYALATASRATTSRRGTTTPPPSGRSSIFWAPGGSGAPTCTSARRVGPTSATPSCFATTCAPRRRPRRPTRGSRRRSPASTRRIRTPTTT